MRTARALEPLAFAASSNSSVSAITPPATASASRPSADAARANTPFLGPASKKSKQTPQKSRTAANKSKRAGYRATVITAQRRQQLPPYRNAALQLEAELPLNCAQAHTFRVHLSENIEIG